MNEKIEFIKESHTYLFNGIIVPSVSQILKFKFPDKYKGISESVLNKKAEFGTRVHELTEQHDKGYAINMIDLPVYERLCLEQHIKLSKKFIFMPIEHEQIVFHEELHYAGTLDTIGLVKGLKSIIDKKCTSKLDKEYVAWQNSLYYYALDDKEIKKSYCEWLPKGELGKLEELEILPYEDIKELVDEFVEKEWQVWMC